MARYVTSVRTARSVEDAFAFMADVRAFSSWDPGVAAVTQVVGDGAGPGAAYDLVIRGRRPMVLRYVVSGYAPPRRLRLVARNAWIVSVDEVRVEPDGDGAIVTYDATLTLRGPLRLFDPWLARAFRTIGDRAAAGLRAALGSP